MASVARHGADDTGIHVSSTASIRQSFEENYHVLDSGSELDQSTWARSPSELKGSVIIEMDNYGKPIGKWWFYGVLWWSYGDLPHGTCLQNNGKPVS